MDMYRRSCKDVVPVPDPASVFSPEEAVDSPLLWKMIESDLEDQKFSKFFSLSGSSSSSQEGSSGYSSGASSAFILEEKAQFLSKKAFNRGLLSTSRSSPPPLLDANDSRLNSRLSSTNVQEFQPEIFSDIAWTAKDKELDELLVIKPPDLSSVVAVVVSSSSLTPVPVSPTPVTTWTWTDNNVRKIYCPHPYSLNYTKYSPVDVVKGAGQTVEKESTPPLEFPPFYVNYIPNFLELGFDQKKAVSFREKLSPRPCAVCSSYNNDKIYVADSDFHQVAVYTRDGRFLTRFGRPGDQFRPSGIQFDALRNRLIVTEKENHRINFFTSEGQYINSFGSFGFGNGQFHHPWGVCISPNGQKIAVADSKNHRVQLFDHEGNFIQKYSEFETNPHECKEQFDYPRAVAFDHKSSFLYVTDSNLHTIFKLDPTFTQRTQMTSPLAQCRPQGISVDQSGNLYVCDSKNHCIRIFSPSGDQLDIIKITGSTPISKPIDISVNHEGYILLLDNVDTKKNTYARVRIF